jgi:hypothetical protein
MPVESPFDFFVQQQNRKMVELLEQNREVSRFFMAILDHLVAHATATGTSFRDLRIEDPHVTADGYIRARVK